MIYLVRSYGKVRSILKIGYTEDNNKEKIISQYYYHNPECEFLGFIDEGTVEDELKLHYKFRKYKLNLLNEWFEDKEEIINYFNSVTLEEISKINIPINYVQFNKFFKGIKFDIEWMIDKMLLSTGARNITDTNQIKSYIDQVVENRITTLELAFEYLVSLPEFANISVTSFENYLVPEKTIKLIDKVFSNCSQFYDRIKEFCCLIQDDNLDIQFIPEPFRSYIQVLGSKYILSIGGRKSVLDKAMNMSLSVGGKIPTKDMIKDNIFAEFKEGSRLSNIELKKNIGEVYKNLGVSKTPKASDIEQWFEVRKILLTDLITKKRINGFELIKKKL